MVRSVQSGSIGGLGSLMGEVITSEVVVTQSSSWVKSVGWVDGLGLIYLEYNKMGGSIVCSLTQSWLQNTDPQMIHVFILKFSNS